MSFIAMTKNGRQACVDMLADAQLNLSHSVAVSFSVHKQDTKEREQKEQTAADGTDMASLQLPAYHDDGEWEVTAPSTGHFSAS